MVTSVRKVENKRKFGGDLICDEKKEYLQVTCLEGGRGQRKWTQKIEESTHPQQYKNKGIVYCVALESESENKK